MKSYRIVGKIGETHAILWVRKTWIGHTLSYSTEQWVVELDNNEPSKLNSAKFLFKLGSNFVK